VVARGCIKKHLSWRAWLIFGHKEGQQNRELKLRTILSKDRAAQRAYLVPLPGPQPLAQRIREIERGVTYLDGVLSIVLES